MIRTILVGLDGSAHSAAAVDLGIRWAQKLNAMLVGLSVIDEPGIRSAQPVPIGGSAFKEHRDTALLAEARKRVETLLGSFSVRCSESGVACKLLEDVGAPAERIVLDAQRYDLILLGQETHYHSESAAKSDDTLTRVLQASPRPVVTVPANLGNGSSVVVAYDGSLQAARTLQLFHSLGLGQTGDIHVLSVHPDHIEAARHADRAIEYLGFHEVKAQRHVIKSAAPAREILHQIEQLGAGLLVMGAYGQPGIKEFFFGSVTRTLLSESPVPLFLYH